MAHRLDWQVWHFAEFGRSAKYAAFRGSAEFVAFAQIAQLTTACRSSDHSNSGILMAVQRATTELVCHGQRFQVPRLDLMAKCRKFENDPALLGRPYDVVARVGIDAWRTFVNAIGGANADITNQNVLDLHLLCREFLFGGLEAQVDAYLRQHGAVDFDSRQQIQALRAKDTEQQGTIEALQREIAALRQELQNVRAMAAAHDAYLRRLADQTTSLIRAQIAASVPTPCFLIVLRVGSEDKAVAFSGEESSGRNDQNRRFALEAPNWSHQNQLFRFGDGADSDMILPVWHPGYVWDQYSQGAHFYLHQPHGGANQRFEYRAADGRIICKQWGEAVTYVGREPPLVGTPCDPARANAQRFEIRFQIADVAAKLQFPT